MNYDIIVSGDSRIYRGVAPAIISSELNGLSVLNFGFSSGGHNSLMFDEIDRRLNKNSDSRVIVLGLTPYSLTPDAQTNGHFLQEKERDAKDVFLRRYINPVLHFFDPISPTELLNYNKNESGYYEVFHKHGWVASKKLPYNPTEAIKKYIRNFKDNRVEDEILKELFEQIEEWTSQGIRVMALRMPTTPEMEQLEEEMGGFDEIKVKEAVIENGGQWIEVDDKFGYFCYDGSHLLDLEAERFSHFLGKAIKLNLEQ